MEEHWNSLPCVPEILSFLDFLMGCFRREWRDERHLRNAGSGLGDQLRSWGSGLCRK
jgi:hypothetical protein